MLHRWGQFLHTVRSRRRLWFRLNLRWTGGMTSIADADAPSRGVVGVGPEAAGAADEGEPATDGDSRATQRVSVVYFHGMGSQRRHEEISRLIDSLDIRSSGQYRSGNTDYGRLAGIHARIEPSRNAELDDVTYIRANFNYRDATGIPARTVCKFYEVYWAPVMAEHSSAHTVLVWMFSQVLRPFRTLPAPWRDRQRLRRSSLIELRDHAERWPAECTEEDFDLLLLAYDDFEGWTARRGYPKGRYRDFKDFLASKCAGEADRLPRLNFLCDSWRSGYRLSEIRNAFLLATLALMLLLVGAMAIGLGFMLLQVLSGWDLDRWLRGLGLSAVADRLEPSVANAVPLVIGAAGLFKLTSFLTAYLGDVELWTTYEETNEKHKKRKEVLKRGFAVLSHVLMDDNCERVVVVGHSLGTAVAQDTLLEAARHNTARNPAVPISEPLPLEKIRHVVTMASPIDKIQYFFESYASAHHRYKRVVEELRGDLGKPPFAKNRKPHAHWINYWDTGDIISGPLHSPSNRAMPHLRVDNVHVSNFTFPDPGASHSAYFYNGRVMDDLCGFIFKNTHNFADAPREQGKPYQYDAVRVGPGAFASGPRGFLFLMIVFPYALLAALAVTATGGGPAAMGATWGLVGAISLVVAAGFISSKINGPSDPL